MGRGLGDKREPIKERKIDHIRICLSRNVEAKNITTGFEDIFFVHRALPEISMEDIDLATEVFG